MSKSRIISKRDISDNTIFMCPECLNVINLSIDANVDVKLKEEIFFKYYDPINITIDNMILCESCKCQMVEIDPDILDIIISLNEKGYLTISCCSGHVPTDKLFALSNAYISFKPGIQLTTTPPPLDWGVESEPYLYFNIDEKMNMNSVLVKQITIRSNKDRSSTSLSNLAAWVNSLEKNVIDKESEAYFSPEKYMFESSFNSKYSSIIGVEESTID